MLYFAIDKQYISSLANASPFIAITYLAISIILLTITDIY